MVDEVRIYGSGGDDPSPTWWEEVGLVFTPVDTLKGSLPPAGVTIPWTAYQRSSGEPGGRRIGPVEPAGLSVTEEDIGTQYVLFLHRDGARGLYLVNLSGGIMAVAPDGTIGPVSPQGVLRGLDGRALDSVVSENLP